jgi:ABC-type uncharacterized transport system permease subunit
MAATTAFRIMLIIAGIITLGAAAGVSIALRLQQWYGIAEALPVVEFICGLVVYFITLAILLAFTWGFSSLQITREKVDGNIESLMATPLGPVTLWLAKCLAVFIPGFVISILSVVIVLLTVNLAAVLPGWGVFAMPGASLVVALFGNPPPLFCRSMFYNAGFPDRQSRRCHRPIFPDWIRLDDRHTGRYGHG